MPCYKDFYSSIPYGDSHVDVKLNIYMGISMRTIMKTTPILLLFQGNYVCLKIGCCYVIIIHCIQIKKLYPVHGFLQSLGLAM